MNMRGGMSQWLCPACRTINAGMAYGCMNCRSPRPSMGGMQPQMMGGQMEPRMMQAGGMGRPPMMGGIGGLPGMHSGGYFNDQMPSHPPRPTPPSSSPPPTTSPPSTSPPPHNPQNALRPTAAPGKTSLAQNTAEVDWVCNTCLYKNVVAGTHCCRCGTQKDKPAPGTKPAPEPAPAPTELPTPAEPIALPPDLAGPRGDWNCLHCSNHNFANRTECNRCKQPKGSGPLPGTTDSNPSGNIADWKCTSCGAHNYAFRNACHKCNAFRPRPGGGTVARPMMPGDWICQTCDENNYSWNNNCSKCKKSKNDDFGGVKTGSKAAATDGVPEDTTFLLERVSIGIYNHVSDKPGRNVKAGSTSPDYLVGKIVWTPKKKDSVGRLRWEWCMAGPGVGKRRVRVEIPFEHILGWQWNSKTWFLTVELSQPPSLFEHAPGATEVVGMPQKAGKKAKKKAAGTWVPADDFTDGAYKACRFHRVKLHCVGVSNIVPALDKFSDYAQRKYDPLRQRGLSPLFFPTSPTEQTFQNIPHIDVSVIAQAESRGIILNKEEDISDVATLNANMARFGGYEVPVGVDGTIMLTAEDVDRLKDSGAKPVSATGSIASLLQGGSASLPGVGPQPAAGAALPQKPLLPTPAPPALPPHLNPQLAAQLAQVTGLPLTAISMLTPQQLVSLGPHVLVVLQKAGLTGAATPGSSAPLLGATSAASTTTTSPASSAPLLASPTPAAAVAPPNPAALKALALAKAKAIATAAQLKGQSQATAMASPAAAAVAPAATTAAAASPPATTNVSTNATNGDATSAGDKRPAEETAGDGERTTKMRKRRSGWDIG